MALQPPNSSIANASLFFILVHNLRHSNENSVLVGLLKHLSTMQAQATSRMHPTGNRCSGRESMRGKNEKAAEIFSAALEISED
ncbi:MAG: hypothetical protein JWM68_4700 [Verrucomicrobiales bacterium]|nr:hypothetical protein [Verrucomicrobiales bacterium]